MAATPPHPPPPPYQITGNTSNKRATDDEDEFNLNQNSLVDTFQQHQQRPFQWTDRRTYGQTDTDGRLSCRENLKWLLPPPPLPQ